MNKKSEQINKQPTNLNRTNCGPFRLLETRLQSLFFQLLCTSPPFLRITSVDPLLRSQRILLSPSPLCNASSHQTNNLLPQSKELSFLLQYVFFPQMIPLLFVPLILRISPNHPMRAAPIRVLLLFFSFFSPIYLNPQDLNLFPKWKNLLFPFFFSFFF